jgi:catechol 2,3-dioxygenase
VNHPDPEASYRLPAGLRLGAVRLQVGDLERSLGWYRTVLGLEVLSVSGNRAVLAPAAATSPLVELVEQPGAVPVPRHGRLGLYHYALLLPDRPALGRFLANGQRLGVRLGAADHLVSEALYLSDPDGLGIEVYADRPRATWRRQAGQLVMASNPLDLADLAAAAAGEQWTGLPGGSVVGHIHLPWATSRRRTVSTPPSASSQRCGATWCALPAGGYHHHWRQHRRGRAARRRAGCRLLEWEIVLPTAADVEKGAGQRACRRPRCRAGGRRWTAARSVGDAAAAEAGA